ncbi:uncharacterized protein BXIN_1925 [Babesia sp. Xinjiang]|uniref:uncharacterized protein n=1 Tax=Babesia sp. Xinjiang TaxID=462227 RepID=UPI000A254D51|nr:uncharacterized protein BXIN_1925 [Babesia sp. Xinjiang]ORM40610.1 hypothetical protein BXIN_1925 [Babesia sp. Xinjiang]
MDEYVLKHFDWSTYFNTARSRFLEGREGVLQSFGFHNIVVAAVISALTYWTIRLWIEFHSIHHVQEQMQQRPKILHLKDMAEFANDLLALTKEHFNAIVKLRHNLVPLPVPRVRMPNSLIARTLKIELDDDEETNFQTGYPASQSAVLTTCLDKLHVSFKMDCSRTTFVSAHWGVPLEIIQKICVESKCAQEEVQEEQFSIAKFLKKFCYIEQEDRYQRLLDMDESTILDTPNGTDERFGRFNVLAYTDKICTSEAVCFDAGKGIRCKVTPPVKTVEVEGVPRSIWEVLLSRVYDDREIIPLVILLYSPRAHETRIFSEGNVESYQGLAEMTLVSFTGRLRLREQLTPTITNPTAIVIDVTKQICFSNDLGRPQETRDMFGMGDETDNDCLICLSNRMDTVLLPCGHASFCFNCLQSLRTEKCPVCRGTFASYIRFPLRNTSIG